MAKNDKLGDHISTLLSALNERLPNDRALRERTAAIAKLNPGDPADYGRWAQEYRAATEETLASMYYRIDLHAAAILKLTDNPNITGPVRTLMHLTQTEIKDVRDLISEVETASSPGDKLMVVLKMVGAGMRGLPRQGQIEAAMQRLETYGNAA